MTNYFLSKYDTDEKYPFSLNKIILEFLGNILLRFDTINSKYIDMIKENGMLIESTTYCSFVTACSVGVRKGIHQFRIRCNSPASGDCAIGIMTNIEQLSKRPSEWITSHSGYKYWWYNGSQILFADKNNKRLDKYYMKQKWGKNDEMMIKIDCNKWLVQFFLNDQVIEKSFNIEPDLVYYLFVAIQANGSKYQLII